MAAANGAVNLNQRHSLVFSSLTLDSTHLQLVVMGTAGFGKEPRLGWEETYRPEGHQIMKRDPCWVVVLHV